jgi:leader peptidase (prepilin peptidase)/N-methyltransferase
VNAIFYALLFIFGAAVGSFLNVVIWRYEPTGSVFDFKNLKGRSHCPHCKKVLRWFELVPVLSFFIQFGRCRSCQNRLSFQYPIVEFVAGLIFLFLPLALNDFYGVRFSAFINLSAPYWYYFLILGWLAVFCIWLVIAFIDFRHYIIPNELNIALAVLGLIITAIVFWQADFFPFFRESFLRHYQLVFSPSQNIFLNRLLGIVFGTLFFGALIILSRGKAMGMGDVKLAFASGFVLGWPDIALTVILAFIFGGFWSAGLLFLKKKRLHNRVPFAPFFVLGAAVTIFWGFDLVAGYFSLFNL